MICVVVAVILNLMANDVFEEATLIWNMIFSASNLFPAHLFSCRDLASFVSFLVFSTSIVSGCACASYPYPHYPFSSSYDLSYYQHPAHPYASYDDVCASSPSQPA